MDDFLRHIYTDILDHLEIKDPEYGENLRYAALQYDTLPPNAPPGAGGPSAGTIKA